MASAVPFAMMTLASALRTRTPKLRASSISRKEPSHVSTVSAVRDLNRNIHELERELTEARNQYGAAAEVIRVIAGAPS
jgi:outer membrane murein-binding lipoprotein Lpp